MFGIFSRSNWLKQLPPKMQDGISEIVKKSIDQYVQKRYGLSDAQVVSLIMATSYADNVTMNDIYKIISSENPGQPESYLAAKTFESFLTSVYTIALASPSISPDREKWIKVVEGYFDSIPAKCKSLRDAKLEYKKIKLMTGNSHEVNSLLELLDNLLVDPLRWGMKS